LPRKIVVDARENFVISEGSVDGVVQMNTNGISLVILPQTLPKCPADGPSEDFLTEETTGTIYQK
jgi:hypothetical protein